MSWKLSSRRPLRGEIRVPGDKSVSHRALMLGALAEGVTVVRGLSAGGDVASTRRCLEGLGVRFEDAGELVQTPHGERWSEVRVHGAGLDGLKVPRKTLDAGNSGTTIRLLTGILAGQQRWARLSGDASLRSRPMRRVAEPLRAMGAEVVLTEGEFAPLKVRGRGLKGIEFRSPVASAQLKSAVLLAGLSAQGETSVVEPAPSRDHTERMLGHFGVRVGKEGNRAWLLGPARLKAAPVLVPGDPSSAAFWLAAACLVPGSELRLPAVDANPTRLGFVDALLAMGARIELAETADQGAGEPLADILASHGPLHAIETRPEDFPAFIDEAPLLAVVATQAEGTTRIRGVGELRYKESDRVRGIVSMLKAFGARAMVEGDDLVIPGYQDLWGGQVDPADDHRIAMAGAVASLAASGDCEVLDPECADISYPGFFSTLDGLLGAA